MTIYTYLLKSKVDSSYYVGITENPDRRLKEHNSGKTKITTLKKPYTLVYIKPHKDYFEARIHEKWLKKKNRKYKKQLENLSTIVSR